ncbi:hypothetical protein [Parabacteroides sp.]
MKKLIKSAITTVLLFIAVVAVAAPEVQYDETFNLSIGEEKTWQPFENAPSATYEQTNDKVADIEESGQGGVTIKGKAVGHTVVTVTNGNQRKMALVKIVKASTSGGGEKLEAVSLTMSVPKQFYFEYVEENFVPGVPAFVARDRDIWSHGYAIWKINNPAADNFVEHINPATGYVYMLSPTHPWTFLGGQGSQQELYGEWFDPREGYSDYAIANIPYKMRSFYDDTDEFGQKRMPKRKETIAGTECYVYEKPFLGDKRTYWVDITNGLTLKYTSSESPVDNFEITVYSLKEPQWNAQMRPSDYSTVEDITGDLLNVPPARRPYVNHNK